VTWPPVARAASASQIVEYAFDRADLEYSSGVHRPDQDPQQATRVARDVEHALGTCRFARVVVLSKLRQMLEELKKCVVHESPSFS